MKRNNKTFIFIISLILSLSLCACGSSSESYYTDSVNGMTSGLNITADTASSSAHYISGFGSSGTKSDYSYYEEEAIVAEEAEEFIEDATEEVIEDINTTNSDVELVESKLIYKCKLNVETLDYDASYTKLQELIDKYDCFIESENYTDNNYEYYSYRDGYKKARENTIVIRIPSENYSDFLNEYRLKTLVKKYSDYIRYPIKMEVTKVVAKKDEEGKEIEGETEEVVSIETLNSQLPIWKKKKNDVTDEELNEFYKTKFYDYQDPLTNIFINIEGALNYTALIYIPKKAPYDLYSENYEKGLQLYSKGVFIMEKCKDLVPDYFRFVKGLVDSNDLSLNISREILQQNNVLTKIASNIEKKIASKLESLLKNDREKYVEFFETYGINLKYGIYDKYGLKKELLQDLIMFKTINSDEYITLKEYIEKMVEGQDSIYYASGKNKDAVMAMPQLDRIKSKGYDVLICSDDVDEFMLQVMTEYDGKKFKSVNQGDADKLEEHEEEKIKEISEDKKSLLEKMKEILHDEVTDVVISRRLTDSPVCLVSTDGLSFEMQKVMEKSPVSKNFKADKVLEINAKHKLFETLENLYNDGDENLADYVELLYNQALLIEGFPVKNPVEFSKKMCELMIKSSKY